MEGDFIKINEWLTPLSWIYGWGVRLRNSLFDWGVLKSRSYEVPVISVGNITVGGTGKTPHVEHLVRLLQDQTNVAVLSRGYKRKSRGFVVAESDTPMRQIGDEPFQMKQKYPKVTVAVDKSRRHGIERLMSNEVVKDVEVILLDDAFQHRYVKPGVNILLVDYHRLIIYDKLLPAGRLREPMDGKSRADIVIVTKCPKDLKPMEFRVIMKAMSLFAYQKLYFTTLEYEPLRAGFAEGKAGGRAATKLQPTGEGETKDRQKAKEGQKAKENEKTKERQKAGELEGTRLEELGAEEHVLLLTGIASPEQVKLDLEGASQCQITQLAYPDHHAFKRKDVERINSDFAALPCPKCIITTEKDVTRLQGLEGLSEEVRQQLYVLPVKISFMLDQEENFNENIIDYVRKNSRNGIVAEGQDADKSKDGHRPRNRTGATGFRNH